jgi:hypothetical protein
VGLYPASAQAGPRHAAAEFALGTLAVASTIPYGIVKVGYAVLGSAVGGLAYLITGFNDETAREVIQPAVRGDYVVRPEHLTADVPITFVGRDPYRP